MKKILSLCLAALMIFSVLPAAFAAEEVETIENIEETSPYAEAIKFLANDSIAVYKGNADGDLAADDGVERWQAARFIYRVATGDVDETDVKTTTNYTNFKDIDIGDFDGSSAETLGAIAWAAQAKITNGTSADEFSPVDGIIYQDAITMIVRLLGERYTAASYPYGFVTTARELGILDGITGIGLEDEITRGVFAQLLYNAIFAPVYNETTEKYETIAAKSLNVGKATVIITASNEVVYGADEITVLREDMVRFAPVNDQGEPATVGYHADFEAFGLEDDKAANVAVGTLYNIYYKDSMAEIIDAEALWSVYWNLGHDNLQISADSTKKTITIDGSTYKIVSSYTDLRRHQGPSTTAEGTAEMKVYVDTGATEKGYGGRYIIGSDGSVYDIQASISTPIYYYSEVLDVYYAVGADGKWVIKTPAQIMSILNNASSTVAGFTKVLSATVSAYTKATVSADERVTLREYEFGVIDYSKKNRSSSDKKVPTFAVANNENGTGKATGWNQSNTLGDSSDEAANANEFFIDEYVWSGYAQSEIPEGSYIIYYLNHNTKEMDVIDIIDSADDGDDSYVIRGYLRNFNISANTIGISEAFTSDIVSYVCDYNTLKGAQLKKYDKDNNKTANFTLFSGLYDKYVELVVVDGKAVYIKGLDQTNDYVIIDTFLDFSEEGIKVQGWSTIDEAYTSFTIRSFNGWTVGGSFDYYAYFLSGFFGNNTTSFQSMIPFTSKTLYKVISSADGVYDLTHATITSATKQYAGSDTATGNILKVNEYGIIEGVNSKGELLASNWVPTADGNYWMILNKDSGEVYQINNKVNPVVEFTKGADVYKALDDFVIVVEDGEMIANDTFLGNSVEYFMYNKSVNLYNNQNFPGYTSYEYVLNMTNVLTNEIEKVVIDNGALNLGATGGYWADQMFESAGLVEGGIYKAVDNKIYKLDAVDYEAVANYYANTKNYEDSAANVGADELVARKVNVAGKTFAQIVDIITADMDVLVTPDMINGTTYHDSKVTIYYPAETRANPTLTGQNKIMGNSTSSSDKAKLEAYVADTGYEYNMYYVIGEDGKAVAWISRSEFSNAIYGVSKPVTTTAYGTITNGVFSGGSVIDEGQTAYIEYNQTHGEFWAYVNNANLTFKDNADWNNAQTNYKVIVTFVNGTTLTLPTADAAIKATQEGNGMNDLISGKATCCSVAFKYTGLGFEPDCVKTVTILIDKVGDARDCQFVIDCQ